MVTDSINSAEQAMDETLELWRKILISIERNDKDCVGHIGWFDDDEEGELYDIEVMKGFFLLGKYYWHDCPLCEYYRKSRRCPFDTTDMDEMDKAEIDNPFLCDCGCAYSYDYADVMSKDDVIKFLDAVVRISEGEHQDGV